MHPPPSASIDRLECRVTRAVCAREALQGCASLDGLIGMLRRPLRLNEALDVELWMLDGAGTCMLVGPTLPPAAVLEVAAGLVLHVKL